MLASSSFWEVLYMHQQPSPFKRFRVKSETTALSLSFHTLHTLLKILLFICYFWSTQTFLILNIFMVHHYYSSYTDAVHIRSPDPTSTADSKMLRIFSITDHAGMTVNIEVSGEINFINNPSSVIDMQDMHNQY